MKGLWGLRLGARARGSHLRGRSRLPPSHRVPQGQRKVSLRCRIRAPQTSFSHSYPLKPCLQTPAMEGVRPSTHGFGGHSLFHGSETEGLLKAKERGSDS